MLKAAESVPYIDQMRSIFYEAVEVLASLHPHLWPLRMPSTLATNRTISPQEKADCLQVIKKEEPRNWPKLKVEFDRWRIAGKSIFPKEVWEAADQLHTWVSISGGSRLEMTLIS